MGKITKGPFVGMKGQVDGYVYYDYKGTTYVRKKKRNQSENSLKQLKKQHTKVKSLAALYKSVKDTILIDAFRVEAENLKMQSGYNLFTRENLKCFDESFRIGDYSFLKLSVGRLSFPFQFRGKELSEGVFEFKWEYPQNVNDKDLMDLLKVAVVYDNDPFKVIMLDIPVVTRKDCEAVIDVRTTGSNEAHVYCFFVNKYGSCFSDSIYYNLKY